MMAICLAFFFLLATAVDVPAQQASSCAVCHSEVRVKYGESSHAQELKCVDCHGGDPTRFDLDAHDQSHGYKGRLTRLEVVKLCSSCHSDPVRMAPYNLRSDQYAQYIGSEHGKQLLRGDLKVAICTDCHSTHRIMSASEPRATTYPPAVPAMCGHCHRDKVLMEQYGLSSGQYADFSKSVHARALEAGDYRKAPTCATCHGAHGAKPPQVADVSRVCGQCHIPERGYFNASPHKPAMDKRKFSECAECHGEHEVREPTRALFDTACGRCHEGGSREFLTGRKIRTLVDRARESLQGAERVVREATATGLDVSVHRSRLPMAWASLREAMVVQHTIDQGRVEDLTRSARSVGEEVQGAVHAAMSESELRSIGLIVVWFFLLCTAVAVYLYKRESLRERGQR